MRKIKGFSYDPIKDADVINHIDNQPLNNSQYIWGLVKKDMSEKENEIEKLVRKYIEKYLDRKEIEEVVKTIDTRGIRDILGK